MNTAIVKIKEAVLQYEQYRGKKPDHIVIDSFLYEELCLEMYGDNNQSVIVKVNEIFGIPIILLRKCLVIS